MDVAGNTWLCVCLLNIGSGPVVLAQRQPSGATDPLGLHVVDRASMPTWFSSLTWEPQAEVVEAAGLCVFAARTDHWDTAWATRLGPLESQAPSSISVNYWDLAGNRYAVSSSLRVDPVTMELRPDGTSYKGYDWS